MLPWCEALSATDVHVLTSFGRLLMARVVRGKKKKDMTECAWTYAAPERAADMWHDTPPAIADTSKEQRSGRIGSPPEKPT